MASEYAINVGDIYTSPQGETVTVTGFSGADPTVLSRKTQAERTIAAGTLVEWRMDGPDHGLPGVGRI